MIKRCSIWDMDGTIVCSLHRYRTTPEGKIDLPYWRANEPLAMRDSLLPMASVYRADLADPHCYVIIATARVLNAPDRQFIREILGEPDHIISRPTGETRSSGILKANGLAKFLNLLPFKDATFTFYEDNIHYLKHVCDTFAPRIRGVYIPSKQGH